MTTQDLSKKLGLKWSRKKPCGETAFLEDKQPLNPRRAEPHRNFQEESPHIRHRGSGSLLQEWRVPKEARGTGAPQTGNGGELAFPLESSGRKVQEDAQLKCNKANLPSIYFLKTGSSFLILIYIKMIILSHLMKCHTRERKLWNCGCLVTIGHNTDGVPLL